MRQTEPVRDSCPRPILHRLAWLPIPLFLAAIVVLRAVGPEVPRESLELALSLNLIFSVMVSLVAQALRVSGRFNLLPSPPGGVWSPVPLHPQPIRTPAQAGG